MNHLIASARAIIRTVTGDITPDSLQSINYHEHLFQVSPLLIGDELDDFSSSSAEARLLAESGTSLMVEATPLGVGGHPYAVADISRMTGLQIVHVTGLHHGGHYSDTHPLRNLSVAELSERFVADIQEGFTLDRNYSGPVQAPVRAGMIKAGIRYWSIGAFESGALEAAAQAHRATGAPLMVHLDYGSAAHEVLDILERFGVAASHVVLAHMDRNLDPGLHVDLIARGAFLGYDGWARHREASDSAILDCLRRVIDAHSAEGVVIGGDVARSSRYLSYGGMPGLSYVERRVVPRMIREFGAETTQLLRAENAIRLLQFIPLATLTVES